MSLNCLNMQSQFYCRGNKQPRKVNTAKIYPRVFEANLRKIGDVKIFKNTVTLNSVSYSRKKMVSDTHLVFFK